MRIDAFVSCAEQDTRVRQCRTSSFKKHATLHFAMLYVVADLPTYVCSMISFLLTCSTIAEHGLSSRSVECETSVHMQVLNQPFACMSQGTCIVPEFRSLIPIQIATREGASKCT